MPCLACSPSASPWRILDDLFPITKHKYWARNSVPNIHSLRRRNASDLLRNAVVIIASNWKLSFSCLSLPLSALALDFLSLELFRRIRRPSGLS